MAVKWKTPNEGALGDSPLHPPVLLAPISIPFTDFRLISDGVASLWNRIVTASPLADSHPLLLSYDVHPTSAGPVLIEVNTNAGGVLAAFRAARALNCCCTNWEQKELYRRLLELFQRDLLGTADDRPVVAIVDDDLAEQPLLGEMQALAKLLSGASERVYVVDAKELRYSRGRLRYMDIPIDRLYWRSTDFVLEDPKHQAVLQAVSERSAIIAPAPDAYRAIADKRRFIDWSNEPVLASDPTSSRSLRIATTVAMSSRSTAEWFGDRKHWVFKPVSGHGSRGVYVGKSISRKRLAELPAEQYLAQEYVPHPVVERDSDEWKYDLRFFADRGEIIGSAARVFQGQVVGMRTSGSGFAPVQIGAMDCFRCAVARLQTERAGRKSELACAGISGPDACRPAAPQY